MSRWRALLLGLFVLVPVAVGAREAPAARAVGPQNVASDTYYTVDTANAGLSVRVEATIQNASSKEMTTALLWAMPSPVDLKVTKDDAPLEVEIVSLPEFPGSLVGVVIKLPRAYKPDARFDVVMTYTMTPQVNQLVRFEPGVMELPFLGQGPGSFVWVDVPTEAENNFDPGCLKATSQPSDVKSAGRERWICGDATLIALNGDDDKVLDRCAAADDACRQRLNWSPYSAFVQSITDTASRATKETQVEIAGKQVKLQLKYFKRDEKWAEEQFQVAQQAIPLLAGLFGFGYDHEALTMRQSHHIEMVGAAGIAFPSKGEVLLATGTGIDREVTIHELAHQWAGFNLETAWLWEGLAEYATRTVAPGLGVKPFDLNWESKPYKDPLATWGNGSAIHDFEYWYAKAGDFWFAYEKAIGGPEYMKAVLSRMDDDPDRLPLDAQWFMDWGELVGGVNLDELFLTWVFNPDTAGPMIAERRVAYDQVRALWARAGALGLDGLPSDLQDNLDHWNFPPIEKQVADTNRVLDSYEKVLAETTAAGLPQVNSLLPRWKTSTIAELAGAVENQRQALKAIMDSTTQLADEPADSPAMPKLNQARERYAAGDFAAAKQLASEALTTAFDKGAAVRMIELAKARQASYKPSLFSRVGLWLEDPASDLRKAEERQAAGEPTEALALARSAYKGWDEAARRGLVRLAMATALMGALCVGVWLLLSRMDRGGKKDNKPGSGGHYLAESPKGSWRDWENSG